MCIMVFACGCGHKQQKDDLSIIKSRGRLIVGVKTDAKPFGFYNANHQLQGYDIDLARAIANAMFGSPNCVRFIPVTTSNRILKLEDEEVDMLISTMSVTNKRRQVLDFSRPYYISGQAMMVRKGSSIRNLQDLDGKHVIVVFGSTGEDNVTTHVPSAIIYGYRTYSEAWNAFKSGKGDAFLADDIILKSYVESNGSFKLLPERYSKEPYAVAFRKTDESLRLQADVNIVISDLQKTGRLSKMRHRWGLK
jgi:aspartate/glutamate/glutamine transport system substrate-binding protein